MAALAEMFFMTSRPTRGGWLTNAGLWVGGILALASALMLRNPLFLLWRPWATLLLWSATLVLPVFFLRRGWRPRCLGDAALTVLWLCALAITVWQENTFFWHKQQVLALTDDADARRLGAHFVIAYSDPQTIRPLVENGLIGGLFLSAQNVKGRSVAAIHAEMTELQALRRRVGLPPLIISADQEGGIVSRMSPPLSAMPSLAEVIADAAPEEIELLAFAYGEKHGRELASIGVNVNFAPLADLSPVDPQPRFDFRSQISRRAIDADPGRVSPAVIGYAHGLEAVGVRATLKHFPGLGRVTGDTHIAPAKLTASQGELERSDWIPFHDGLRATQSLLMVGHATLSAIDPKRPASRSPKVIRQIVRQYWQHDGLLITDDLTMGAVVRQGLCGAGVDALNAGIDLLLVSYDTEQYYKIFNCLLQAEKNGQLERSLLDESQRRLKHLHGSLVRQRFLSLSGIACHLQKTESSTDSGFGEHQNKKADLKRSAFFATPL